MAIGESRWLFCWGCFASGFEHAGNGNRAALEWTAEGGCPHFYLFIYFLGLHIS